MLSRGICIYDEVKIKAMYRLVVRFIIFDYLNI